MVLQPFVEWQFLMLMIVDVQGEKHRIMHHLQEERK